MNIKEGDVLYSLCNGDISFTEAATLLEVSQEKVEELLSNYTWIPSPEKLSELHDVAMETLSQIHKEKKFDQIPYKSFRSTFLVKDLKEFLNKFDEDDEISIMAKVFAKDKRISKIDEPI